MYSRSLLLVLAIGFGILTVLIAILGFGAIRRADAIYRDMQAAQDAYSQTETFRRGIATDIYLADILLRDYLLDPSPASASARKSSSKIWIGRLVRTNGSESSALTVQANPLC